MKSTKEKVTSADSPDKELDKFEKLEKTGEQFDVFVHQLRLVQGKLARIVNILRNIQLPPVATLRAYQKKVDDTYKEYHSIYAKIIQIVPPKLLEKQDLLFDSFDDLHMKVLTVIEEKLEEVSRTTRGSNTSTQGAVNETKNFPRCVADMSKEANHQHAWRLLEKRFDELNKTTPCQRKSPIQHGKRPKQDISNKKEAIISESGGNAVEDAPRTAKNREVVKPIHQPMVTKAGIKPATKHNVCGKIQHKSLKCPQISHRLAKGRGKRLCFKCIRVGRASAERVSTGTCSTCKARHHNLLHGQRRRKPERMKQTLPPRMEQPGAIQRAVSSQATSSTRREQLAPDVLRTAVVDFLQKHRSPQPCLVLLNLGAKGNTTQIMGEFRPNGVGLVLDYAIGNCTELDEPIRQQLQVSTGEVASPGNRKEMKVKQRLKPKHLTEEYPHEFEDFELFKKKIKLKDFMKKKKYYLPCLVAQSSKTTIRNIADLFLSDKMKERVASLPGTSSEAKEQQERKMFTNWSHEAALLASSLGIFECASVWKACEVFEIEEIVAEVPWIAEERKQQQVSKNNAGVAWSTDTASEFRGLPGISTSQDPHVQSSKDGQIQEEKCSLKQPGPFRHGMVVGNTGPEILQVGSSANTGQRTFQLMIAWR